MTSSRYTIDHLFCDIGRLATLTDVVTTAAIDIDSPDKSLDDYRNEVARLTDLLWITRDLAATINGRTQEAYDTLCEEKAAIRKAVAS